MGSTILKNPVLAGQPSNLTADNRDGYPTHSMLIPEARKPNGDPTMNVAEIICNHPSEIAERLDSPQVRHRPPDLIQ
jgi:hypothetical protein